MTSERVGSLFFLAVSAAFLYAVLQMPLGTRQEPGPGFMPLLLAIIMLSLAGGLALRALIFNPPAQETTDKGSFLRVILIVAGLVLYSLLLSYIGFSVLSFLFLIVFMRLLGVRRWGIILLVAFFATLVAFLVFQTWLQVPFPKGIWWPW